MLVRIVLFVDPAALRRRMARLLGRSNVLVTTVPRRGSLWEHLSRSNCDLIVVHRRGLAGPIPEQIASIRSLPDNPDVIVISDREDPEERGGLLAAGCLAVVHEGLSDDIIRETFTTLVARRREYALSRLGRAGGAETSRLSDFVSSSPAMQSFMPLVKRVVASDSSILIQGETGVGKERLAKAIHEEGSRSQGPFMAIGCGAVPETLLESELFGHEEGAFTGAVRAHRGYFELAHGGTIFLDEIGEMPLHLQVKLLRVLQERRLYRLGSEHAVAVDVRVMAATNRDLVHEMQAKRFRPDLYYRLGVVTLTIPPLRERREDVPALVDSYLDYFRTRLKRQISGVRPDAKDALVQHHWPGNVRELINVIERAVLLCAGDEITPDDLPQTITAPRSPATTVARVPSPLDATASDILCKPLRVARREMVRDFERTYLKDLLRSTGGRVGLSARRAGMGPRSF